MTSRRYLNFDLLLEQRGDGQYEARVTASPVTDLPHVSFRLPFDEKSLQILLMTLDPGRTDVRGVGDSQQRAAKEFGGPLFKAIFTETVGLAWTRSLDRVAAGDAGGLRLRLRVADEAADLAGLPWELLYDEKDRAFPAQSEITPLVRFLDVFSEAEPIQVSGPLRVLAIISSPVDLPELNVEREWTRIQTAMSAKVREGLVVLDRLPEATVDALGEWLLNHDTHVIHFVGHGDFDSGGGEGFIYFQNERGGADPVTAAVLGPFVHDHDPLRMIVMNACRSARVDRTDPYGGMAQGLVLQGATAVVAMQFPITDQAAVMFTGKFYGALATGLPVDQAVSYARKTLQAKFRSEWATPVLFMRSPDGNLFQDLHAPPGWTLHEPSDPRPTTPDDRDPVLVELPPTDLEVTDIIGPDTTDPTGAPTPRDVSLAESDPYGFLFDPEASEPEHQERQEPKPPTAGWVRAHLKLLTATAAALIVVIAVGIAVPLFGGDDHPLQPLPDSQMLVAAGDGSKHLDIYRIDATDSSQQPEQLTHGGESSLPVLSPDRTKMVYVRPLDGGIRTLRTASAIDGSGDRQLVLPPECSTNVSRPAWIPGSEDLVLRCVQGDVVRLVRIDQDGNLVDSLLTVGSGQAAQLTFLGDPTVSGDGHTVVFYGQKANPPNPPIKDGGTLYQLDLDSPPEFDLRTLRPSGPDDTFVYSDATFSQQTSGEEWLAWRAANTTETGATNFEVYAARFTNGHLGKPRRISDPGSPAKEQNPTFSPDGKRIVYVAQEYVPGGQGELQDAQALWIASLDNPDDRRHLSADNPQYWAVPAWSGR